MKLGEVVKLAQGHTAAGCRSKDLNLGLSEYRDCFIKLLQDVHWTPLYPLIHPPAGR